MEDDDRENKTLRMDREEGKLRGWHLPDDLTRMILLRVPANDLICYKLVCKLWLSLISSPDFVSDQIKLSISDPSRNHLLLLHIDPLYNYLPRPARSILYLVAPHVVVVGAANGLLCVVGKFSAWTMSNHDIWILNPVTGHIVKLPVPSDPLRDGGTGYFMFWWDSIAAHGDGEYKLVKILCKWGDVVNKPVASVWVSSSPEIWSDIPVDLDDYLHHPYPSGCDVVIGDFAYWIVFRTDSRDLHVLSLNLKTLALSLYEFPFPVHYGRHFSPNEIYSKLHDKWKYALFAANWKGQFALVERTDRKYVVHTMDAVEGWTEKGSYAFPLLKWIHDVNGKAVVMIKVDPLEYGVALYDVGTGKVEVIEDFLSGEDDVVASAYDFVGSFASIEGFKPIEDTDNIRVFWPYPSAFRNNGNMDSAVHRAVRANVELNSHTYKFTYFDIFP